MERRMPSFCYTRAGGLSQAGSEEHDGFVTTLQSLQQPDSGLFPGRGHHSVLGTAYAMSALELLDNKPLFF
jgi:hypothetical protein